MSAPIHSQAHLMSHLKEKTQAVQFDLETIIATLSAPVVYGNSPGKPPKDDPGLSMVHHHLKAAELQIRQAMKLVGASPRPPIPR